MGWSLDKITEIKFNVFKYSAEVPKKRINITRYAVSTVAIAMSIPFVSIGYLYSYSVVC